MKTLLLMLFSAVCVWVFSPILPSPQDVFVKVLFDESITTSENITPVSEGVPMSESSLAPDPVFFNDYEILFNEYRHDSGLIPLIFTDDLNHNANMRLRELLIDFSHNSKGGYNNRLAENIIMGVNNNFDALLCWQDSLGHRTNMLNGDYKYSGYAFGNGYALQLFSSRQTLNGVPQLPEGWYYVD